MEINSCMECNAKPAHDGFCLTCWAKSPTCSNCEANDPWRGGLCVYCHVDGRYYRPNKGITELLLGDDDNEIAW